MTVIHFNQPSNQLLRELDHPAITFMLNPLSSNLSSHRAFV